MGYAFSLFLIATGAILKYAVTGDFEGIELSTVGMILMVVGLVGFLFTLGTHLLWAERNGYDDHPTNVVDDDPLRPVRRRRRWYR